MIGGECSSDCDCGFLKCFFLCIGFSLEWDLNLGHCGSGALKGQHTLCNKLHEVYLSLIKATS